MSKYSKKVREEAALACQIMACDRATDRWVMSTYEAAGHPPRHLHRRDAFDLAVRAFCDAYAGQTPPERWGDAESLLRCGWTPGDLVTTCNDPDTGAPGTPSYMSMGD
jgi:hypothetical protein